MTFPVLSWLTSHMFGGDSLLRIPVAIRQQEHMKYMFNHNIY